MTVIISQFILNFHYDQMDSISFPEHIFLIVLRIFVKIFIVECLCDYFEEENEDEESIVASISIHFFYKQS